MQQKLVASCCVAKSTSIGRTRYFTVPYKSSSYYHYHYYY